MLGNNIMRLNGDTMCAAVQMYLESLFSGDAPKVVYVTELPNDNCFEIRLESPSDETK